MMAAASGSTLSYNRTYVELKQVKEDTKKGVDEL